MGLRHFILSAALATLFCHSTVSAEQPVVGAVQHRVQSGETLGTLSRYYGVAPEELRALNGGMPPTPGREFWIPPHKSWPTHRVQEGQTLIEISASFGISEHQLREANNLALGEPKSGTLLVLPCAKKPQWTARKAPRLSSRAGSHTDQRTVLRSPLAGSKTGAGERASGLSQAWTKVVLGDGRAAWVRSEAISLEKRSPEVVPLPGSLSFGQRLSEEQKRSVFLMTEELGRRGFQVQADDIVNFMALETGGTFDPSTRSSRNGAVGLAQFTDIAIADLNTRRPSADKLSKERLATMSFPEQCEIVTDYLATAFERKGMKGKVIHSSDLYSAIFCPKAIGLPLGSTVYSSSRDPGPYSRNRSLDSDRDGRITKTEMIVRLTEWARRGHSQRG